MKQFLKIKIICASSEEAEILIAKLSEINFYAFEEENNLLNAYVNEEDFDEEKLKEILPSQTIFTKKIIKEENWNQQWESQLKPVIINSFVAIRPSFSPPINSVQHELIITPKMSFGTGHHATTHLMVELMEGLDFKNKKVVDFGTGTGVLSILAEKLGALSVVALDNDDWSIENAAENIKANQCIKNVLRKQDSLSGIDLVDILLANINVNVLKQTSKDMSSAVKNGGFLVISGFFISDEQEMENVFRENGFVKTKSKFRGDWIGLLFQKL